MAAKLKVLVAAHSSSEGGAEYCLDTTLHHLDRQRFAPVVLFPDEGPMIERVRAQGFPAEVHSTTHWLYFQKDWWFWKNLIGRTWWNVFRLAYRLRRDRFDLVYSNTSAIFEAALAAKIARVPHVWHVHEVLEDGTQMNQLLPLPVIKRMIYALSTGVVFESSSSRQIFDRTCSGDKSHVVHNSLRELPSGVPSGLPPFRRREEEFVVGFIGQFIPRKNPLLLIEALKEEVPSNVRAVFVGDGPLKGEMQLAIEQTDLGGRCQILPFAQDISPVLQHIDALVLTSRQESFGLVLLEAGAFHKPVIACRSEGPNEIIEDGHTGFLIPQDDASELRRRLTQLAGDSALVREIGEAGAARVSARFDGASNTRLLEGLLERAIGSTRVPSKTKMPVG